MTKIEGGHVDDRVGAVPGPDSVDSKQARIGARHRARLSARPGSLEVGHM